MRPNRNAFQRILQPGIGIDAVQLGRADERLDDGRPLSGAFGSDEHPVFLADGDGTEGPLHRVVVDRQITGQRVAVQNGVKNFPGPWGKER